MTVTFPALRYPTTPITPQGAYYFLTGIHPTVRLRAWDNSTVIELMGGGSIPDKFVAPECVQISAPPKGLIGPWKTIDQQSATEDGVTFLDAVNEPMEIELPVRCTARNGQYLRKVVRTLFGCLDTKRTSTLSWFTPDLGYWWADVRWIKTPMEGYRIGGQRRTIDLTIRLRVDSGSWRGLDDVSEFRFGYGEVSDSFDTDYTAEKNLGPNWPIFLTGNGGGYPYAAKGAARWKDDPKKVFFTSARTFVAGPHKDFATETDLQVSAIQLGTMLEIGSAVDIWCRMGATSSGAWNGYGVRARMTGQTVVLSAFNNFTETVMKTWLNVVPPWFGERWRLEAGDTEGNSRVFRVKRGFGGGEGLTTLYYNDEAGVSPLGSGFRGVGFGGYASGAIITQGTPASIREFTAGDASEATQSGFIERVNYGDQDRWDRYTCYGPGMFEIAAGPGSTDMVRFGPLLPHQIVRLNSDNRKRAIVDLTAVPPTAGELLDYREAMRDLESYAPIGNIGPTVQSNASLFDVVPPQGNLHRLLTGRFTRPIPAKSPGRVADTHTVAVSITDGDAGSRIIAHGTPIRRFPQ